MKIPISRRPFFFPHTEFEAIRHTVYYHFDLELIRTFFVSREAAAIGLKGHGNERKRPDSSTLVVNLDSIALAKKSQSRRSASLRKPPRREQRKFSFFACRDSP